MSRLLVSVRSVEEAKAALAGGADLIDVKEPAHGSLGRASDSVIRDILSFVASRQPVSAALGEVEDHPTPFSDRGLMFAKCGLSGCSQSPDWQWNLRRLASLQQQIDPACQLVPVAYADWKRASAPSPLEVCTLACESPFGAFLLDTWQKDGTSLLDWLSVDEIDHLCRVCRAAGRPIALAGSLGQTQIAALTSAEPDWFAVRGAACQGKDRSQVIDLEAVRGLTQLVHTLAGLPAAEIYSCHRESILDQFGKVGIHKPPPAGLRPTHIPGHID